MEHKPVRPTVKTPAQNFTGDVYMTPICSGTGPSRMNAALVRFRPGARTTSENFMSHLALLESRPDGGDPTTWLEPVPQDEFQQAGQRLTAF